MRHSGRFFVCLGARGTKAPVSELHGDLAERRRQLDRWQERSKTRYQTGRLCRGFKKTRQLADDPPDYLWSSPMLE